MNLHRELEALNERFRLDCRLPAPDKSSNDRIGVMRWKFESLWWRMCIEVDHFDVTYANEVPGHPKVYSNRLFNHDKVDEMVTWLKSTGMDVRTEPERFGLPVPTHTAVTPSAIHWFFGTGILMSFVQDIRYGSCCRSDGASFCAWCTSHPTWGLKYWDSAKEACEWLKDHLLAQEVTQ
jgi:hypothetical protein